MLHASYAARSSLEDRRRNREGECARTRLLVRARRICSAQVSCRSELARLLSSRVNSNRTRRVRLQDLVVWVVFVLYEGVDVVFVLHATLSVLGIQTGHIPPEQQGNAAHPPVRPKTSERESVCVPEWKRLRCKVRDASRPVCDRAKFVPYF